MVFERRSPVEIVADTSLALIRPRVEPALTGMTWTAWRQQNRRIAVDMARAGLDAAAIDDAHREHSERKGRVTIMLLYVQRDLATNAASLTCDDDRPPLFEELMPPDELAAFRERQFAKHPEWLRAEAQ